MTLFVSLAFLTLLLRPPAVAGAHQTLPDADARELAFYRLTLPNLNKVINVNRTVLQALVDDPNVQEGLAIDAELEALTRKQQRTEADEERIADLQERKERLDEALDNPLGGDARNLDEIETRIKRYPPMAQALARESMAPREYAKFWLTFLRAAFAHGFQKAGMLKELPADVHPDNVRFIADHQAEIEAMQREFERLARRK